MSLLITILILCVVFGLIYWIIGLLPIPAPFKTVVLVILGIIALIYLFGILFGFAGFQPVVWR
jgi:hypothetical protein